DDLLGKLENLLKSKEVYTYKSGLQHSINMTEMKSYRVIEVYIAMTQATSQFEDLKAKTITFRSSYNTVNYSGILGKDVGDGNFIYYKVFEENNILKIETNSNIYIYARVRCYNY
ncbi:MAG: hypothetical protein RR693_08485, partial [Cetobacterium sp.]|uniref:hypothetical protein n=1 Tax=Cetobacterium sp. TaxID=2071632 RepID=UPI002FC889D4